MENQGTTKENNHPNARVHGHLVQLVLPAHDRPRGGAGREVAAATGEGLRLDKGKKNTPLSVTKYSPLSPPPNIQGS